MTGKKVLRCFLWCMVIGTAVMIFVFSSADGDTSHGTSLHVMEYLMKLLHVHVASDTKTAELLEFILRKIGHFAEYTLLGFWTRMLVQSYAIRGYPTGVAQMAGSLYAASDELHQVFVSARSASWKDVLLDSFGVWNGIMIAGIVILLWRRCGKHREAVTHNENS